jgi:hemerythrin superfamily protein
LGRFAPTRRAELGGSMRPPCLAHKRARTRAAWARELPNHRAAIRQLKETTMSTRNATATKKAPGRSNQAKPSIDAIALLMADHKEVKTLFKQYDKLAKGNGADEDKQRLAEQICAMLTLHATVEEEIFYPAAKDPFDEPDLIDEATVEHASAKNLIAQVESSSPDDDMYDAKVKVLAEYIEHHVKEEEGEIFPKAKKAGLDLDALGEQMADRRQELQPDPLQA